MLDLLNKDIKKFWHQCEDSNITLTENLSSISIWKGENYFIFLKGVKTKLNKNFRFKLNVKHTHVTYSDNVIATATSYNVGLTHKFFFLN